LRVPALEDSTAAGNTSLGVNVVVLAAVDLCMSLSVSRCTFVLVQITRYQQIIGVHTLQAPTETAKVGLVDFTATDAHAALISK